ncbi:hypothetical protein B0H14DRAFT_3881867 [Mycena olivaceomarginata]|nr:hypothetical protein B0H14DRAFT_3881867 [Mycena olivaceomarginata]
MSDYAYAFKASPPPQQNHYGSPGCHATSSYISPSSSSQISSSSTHTNPATPASGNTSNTGTNNKPIAPPTALLWTNREPWMDAEYARQVCALMRWEAGVLVPSPHPHPPSSSSSSAGFYGSGGSGGFSSNAANANPSGTGGNNAGYAVLSFAYAGAAAGALAQTYVVGQLRLGAGSNYGGIVQQSDGTKGNSVTRAELLNSVANMRFTYNGHRRRTTCPFTCSSTRLPMLSHLPQKPSILCLYASLYLLTAN